MSERIGVLIAVLSSSFGGTAGAVTRYMVGVIDPVTIAAFRFGIGAIVLLPIALVMRSPLPRGRDWLGVSCLGVMFFGIFFIFYNIAMSFTTAARGALALSTLPLWTMGYLGAFGGAAAFFLWVLALRMTTPTRVASTMTVNPVAASLLAVILVGEPVGWNLVVGLVAVALGIWVAATSAPARGRDRVPAP